MPKLSLPESMRLFFSGIILYLCIYIVYPEETGKFAISSGAMGFPLILGVTGSLIYFIYRPIIYDPIIERLQLKWNPFGRNYRQEFINRYAISFDQTTRLFILVRNTYLQDKYVQLSLQGAGIHLLYQASILLLTIGVTVGIVNGFETKPIALIVSGIFTFCAGYLYDSKYEMLERDMIMELGWKKIDLIAKNLGYEKKTFIPD